MEMITKEQFNEAYNKYAPNKFIKFMYTYYNLGGRNPREPVAWGTLLAAIGWTIGTVGMIVCDQLGLKDLAINFLWAYVPFGVLIMWIPTSLMNKIRIIKIARTLGVSMKEYNKLSDRFHEKT